jgi:putative PIN family toxin of toxin-antitoxin system
VVRLARDYHTVLASQATLDELDAVLARDKFDRYFLPEARSHFLAEFSALVEPIEIIRIIEASTDPDDNRYLEVAINGEADCTITGDRELLVLHPSEALTFLMS